MNNIIKRVWNQNKMVNIEALQGMTFQAESGGHTFQISGVDDTGAAVPLSGTVAGVFMRPDRADIALVGSASDGVVSVTLTDDCYAVPGRFGLTIFVTSGGQKTAVYAAVGTVSVTSGGGVAGETPQDVVDLINAIAAAVATIPASYTDFMTAIAPVYSSSALYPLGAYSWYDGHLYRCTTHITTAETWTAAHWTAAVLGNDVGGLKSALSNNVIDVLRFGVEPSSYTGAGITATKISDGVFHFSGTISGSNFFSYYSNENSLPYWLEKGKPYYLSVSGATANNKIYFEVLGFRNGSTQISLSGRKYNDGLYEFTIPSDFVGGALVRVGWLRDHIDTVVDETIEYHIYDAPMTGKEMVPVVQNALYYDADTTDSGLASCDNLEPERIIFVSSYQGTLNVPDFPFSTPGTLVCVGSPYYPIQYAFSWNTSELIVKSRSKGTNGWSSWVEHPAPSKIETFNEWAVTAGITSCDDIDTISWYIVSSIGGVPSPSDFPFNEAGWIQTIPFNNYILQIAFSFGNQMKTRTKNGSVWSSWKDIGTGGQTITITQEVSRDTYNNSYEINCSPQITTDSNGWLQAIDTNTSDETGKTDMTGAIMTMLNNTGYCHLGPGIFYVSGNIDMPADSMIEGCGKKTIIRLLQSVSSGYIVRMHTRSTLKNVCLSGGYSELDISTSDIGGRKGINYIGNRDGQSSGVTPTTCTCCQIDGCWFENLDSGFYGYNAGGGLHEGVICNNCFFYRCKAGINIDYWTEYCKFTNIITFQCYYACINNGGNNVFTACTFHGVIGFLIDNSSGTKSNSAHGTVNGCTFNHIDNMNHPETLGNGYGIKVIDTTAGFIFANCQIWYGKVYVEDSNGVQFADCEFGGYPTIETSGNDMVFFHGCIFQSAPTKTITSPVKFDNCYTYAGVSVTE